MNETTYLQVGWSKKRAEHWRGFIQRHELPDGCGDSFIATIWIGRRYDINRDCFATCLIFRGKILFSLLHPRFRTAQVKP